MTYTKEQIKENILTKDAWTLRALLAIYERQTASEQAAGQTIEHNGVGFTGPDAEILSSIADFYSRRGFVTERQMGVVRRRIGKYAGQLTKIANGKVA